MSEMQVNKNKQIQQTQSSAPSQKAADGGSSRSQGNIPVGKNSGASDKYTRLIQSEEFLALSYDEKLAVLKKEFPEADEAALKTLIATSAPAVENAAPAAPKTDSAESAEEALISEYAEKLGENVSFDDVIAAIKAKPAKDLTDTEKKILEVFGSDKTLSHKDVKKLIDEYADKLDNMIPQDVIQSEAWQSKSPAEKLNARMDALLNSMMENYDKFPDEVKVTLRQQLVDKLGKLIDPEWEKKSQTEKDFGLQLIATMAEATEDSNMTIKDCLNMRHRDRVKLLAKYAGQKIESGFIDNPDINPDDLKNMSTDDVLDIALSSIVRSVDPNLSGDEFEAMKRQWMNNIGSKAFGADWDDPKRRPMLLNQLATQLSAIKYYNSTLEGAENPVALTDFMADMKDNARVMDVYEEYAGIKLSEQQQIHRKLRKDGVHPTNANIKKHLEETAKQRPLKKAEQAELDRINNIEKDIKDPKKLKKVMEREVADPSTTGAYYIENKYHGNVDAYLEDVAKLYSKEGDEIKSVNELAPSERIAILADIGDMEMMYKVAEKMGYNPDTVVTELGLNLADVVQYKSSIKNRRFRARLGGALAHSKNDDIREYSNRSEVRETTGHIEEAKIFTEAALVGARAKENAQDIPALYHENGAEKEFMANLNVDICKNENIQDNIAGMFLDSTVKTAPDDDTRIFYSQEVSENVDNPNILEYLGAASKYVQNPDKRTEYTAPAETAAKKYPPEVQTRITQAIETGEVSPIASGAGDSVQSQSQVSQNYQGQVQGQGLGNKNTPSTGSGYIPGAEVSFGSQNRQNTYQGFQPSSSQTVYNPSDADTSGKFGAAEVNPSQNKSAQVQSSQPQIVPQTSSSQVRNDRVSASAVNIDEINQQAAEALYDKKNEALENLEQVRDHINQEIQEFNDRDLKELNDILEEADVNHLEKEVVSKFKEFVSKHNLETIYSKLIDRLGSGMIDKFISLVVASSPEKILALAKVIKSHNDSERLMALYKRYPSKQILNLMDNSTKKLLISTASDLSQFEPKLIYEYLLTLLSGATDIRQFERFMPYLSEYSQHFINAFNLAKGVVQSSNEDDVQNDAPAQAQPMIKQNEVYKTRNDGVTIKRKETFAGISDNIDEQSYDIVDDGTGRTKSQRETVLTPGSYEWAQKYNKQADTGIPFTLFPEEDEQDDSVGVFGSNKVGMGQKIKKKYKSNEFKYNA